MRTPTAGPAALASALILLVRPNAASSFAVRPFAVAPSGSAHRNPTHLHGIFDALKDAFSNDEALSPDKGEGQLEGPGIGSDFRSDADLTDVQKKWLASQQAVPKGGADPSALAADAAGGNVKGAPLTAEKLIGTKWNLSLYLSGIPQRDPEGEQEAEAQAQQ